MDSGRNVLVSGGTRGVGLAIARKLAQDGFCVFALGRKESDGLTAAIAEHPNGALNFVKILPTEGAEALEDRVEGVPTFAKEAGVVG